MTTKLEKPLKREIKIKGEERFVGVDTECAAHREVGAAIAIDLLGHRLGQQGARASAGTRGSSPTIQVSDA